MVAHSCCLVKARFQCTAMYTLCDMREMYAEPVKEVISNVEDTGRLGMHE